MQKVVVSMKLLSDLECAMLSKNLTNHQQLCRNRGMLSCIHEIVIGDEVADKACASIVTIIGMTKLFKAFSTLSELKSLTIHESVISGAASDDGCLLSELLLLTDMLVHSLSNLTDLHVCDAILADKSKFTPADVHIMSRIQSSLAVNRRLLITETPHEEFDLFIDRKLRYSPCEVASVPKIDLAVIDEGFLNKYGREIGKRSLVMNGDSYSIRRHI